MRVTWHYLVVGGEESLSASDRKPVLLGGYAAKQCPVRTHNDFSRLVPTPDWEPSDEEKADLEAGKQFEAEVFAELRTIHPTTSVLVDSRLRKKDAIELTLTSMQSGVPLIFGGWLPDDEAGGRTGKPDILVKFDDGYLPADVKHHKTLEPAKRASKTVSSFARPELWWDAPGMTASAHHYEDGLQLAHYTRMLQACGFHPGDGPLVGAIVGTSLVSVSGSDPELVFAWHDLTKTVRRATFSRSRGKAFRSLLELYDHEHNLRVRVADAAQRITGSSADPEPLVIPIGQKECERCPYGEWCSDQMGSDDDASAAITRDSSRSAKVVNRR